MADYTLIPVHYFHRISIDLNMWFISVEDEGGYIKLPSMSVIRFEMDLRTFDALHMPATFFCTPLALVPTQTSTRATLDSSP